jgi:hypothetical protein
MCYSEGLVAFIPALHLQHETHSQTAGGRTRCLL